MLSMIARSRVFQPPAHVSGPFVPWSLVASHCVQLIVALFHNRNARNEVYSLPQAEPAAAADRASNLLYKLCKIRNLTGHQGRIQKI